MVPVTGGVFTMGSSAQAAGHTAAESPQRNVTVDDFWISRFEIDWQQYELFVYRDEIEFAKRAPDDALEALAIDGVTGATAPYVDMSFGMGKEGYPAINVTRYARPGLCTLVECTHRPVYTACPPKQNGSTPAAPAPTRPGLSAATPPMRSSTQYSPTTATVGMHLQVAAHPNPLGLHDMHGNVAEWTLDAFAPYPAGAADNPYLRPDKLYPGVVRGGSWMDDPAALRCRRPPTLLGRLETAGPTDTQKPVVAHQCALRGFLVWLHRAVNRRQLTSNNTGWMRWRIMASDQASEDLK